MFAKELQRTLPPQTPSQTEGSFYPNRLSLDTLGNPLRIATVEIWQVDNQGPYLSQIAPGEKATTKISGALVDS